MISVAAVYFIKYLKPCDRSTPRFLCCRFLHDVTDVQGGGLQHGSRRNRSAADSVERRSRGHFSLLVKERHIVEPNGVSLSAVTDSTVS